MWWKQHFPDAEVAGCDIFAPVIITLKAIQAETCKIPKTISEAKYIKLATDVKNPLHVIVHFGCSHIGKPGDKYNAAKIKLKLGRVARKIQTKSHLLQGIF